MKITPSSIKSPAAGTVAGARADGVAGSPASVQNAGGSGKSAVDLSPAARHLANLQNSDNDVNVARVQEIRDALAS
ncbi:MAG TPA: flagellar biosynthesis anti-sigma factor FlgM, partial [Burkholderiaceae bacterium]|nr:flagellar biosynthesis anti-sigma factor FlgM [Burkholderiaceae bacterium]